MIIATGDIETRGLGGELICISLALSHKTVRTFDSMKKFFASLFGTITEVIYFHFGGKYDFLYILSWLLRDGKIDGYEIVANSFFEVQGRIISFKVKKGNKVVNFRDSYALLPTSLNSLALSMVGRGKISSGDNIDNMTIEEIISYCEDDARLLYDCIICAMNHFATENLSLTLASQALADCVKRSGELPFKKPSRAVYEFEKLANFGGHVDVYKRYSEPVYCYDISSCYPYSAMQVGCPTGEGHVVFKRSTGKVGSYLAVVNQSSFNPCVPVNARRGADTSDKLYFPVGNFRAFITDIFCDTFPDKVQRIICGVEYEGRDDNYFSDYMRYWYNYRQGGDAQNLIGKLLMNNLLGKFSISRDREQMVIGANEVDYYVDLELKIGKVKKWIDFEYSCPTANSRVTEFGRLLLAHYQNRAGDSLVYSDTDSVKCSKPIESGKKELGELVYEGEYSRGYFLAPKLYGTFDKKNVVGNEPTSQIHAKGALRIKEVSEADIEYNKQAELREKGISEADLRNALEYGIGIETRAHGMNSWKIAARSKQDFVQAVFKSRVMENFSLKRKLLDNGIDTVPFHIAELKVRKDYELLSQEI